MPRFKSLTNLRHQAVEAAGICRIIAFLTAANCGRVIQDCFIERSKNRFRLKKILTKRGIGLPATLIRFFCVPCCNKNPHTLVSHLFTIRLRNFNLV